MKLFVSALEYSANVHLKYLLRELALRENVELCGIFDESILDSAKSQNLGGKSLSLRDSAKQNRGKPPIEKTQKLQGGLPRFAKGKSRNDESKKFCARGTSLCNIDSIAVMGFIDVLKKAKFFLQLRAKCLNLALSADKVLLMDSSSFNIPLAKMIKSRNPNKRIIYYILPQVWAWKPWRAKAIEANCDKLAAILPFEVERYEKKAEFVGHPLLDEIKYFRGGNSVANSSLELHSAESSDKIKSKKPIKSFCYFWLLPKVESPLPLNPNLPNNADSANRAQIAESSTIFSFMPGSRIAEIKRIFPIFLQVKDALKARDKGAKFHLIIPQKFASQNLAQIYGDLSDFHISFDAHLSLFQSRFAFICSGTATLECALIGTPFVLGYKCRAFEAFIARCFLKIKFIGLANILYEKISPNETFHTELIQGDLNARNLLNALDSANKSEFLRKSLALRKYLKNGASKAVAKMLYDL